MSWVSVVSVVDFWFARLWSPREDPCSAVRTEAWRRQRARGLRLPARGSGRSDPCGTVLALPRESGVLPGGGRSPTTQPRKGAHAGLRAPSQWAAEATAGPASVASPVTSQPGGLTEICGSPHVPSTAPPCPLSTAGGTLRLHWGAVFTGCARSLEPAEGLGSLMSLREPPCTPTLGHVRTLAAVECSYHRPWERTPPSRGPLPLARILGAAPEQARADGASVGGCLVGWVSSQKRAFSCLPPRFGVHSILLT